MAMKCLVLHVAILATGKNKRTKYFSRWVLFEQQQQQKISFHTPFLNSTLTHGTVTGRYKSPVQQQRREGPTSREHICRGVCAPERRPVEPHAGNEPTVMGDESKEKGALITHRMSPRCL